MAEITLRPMWKKELAGICGIGRGTLNKQLAAYAKINKDFGAWQGKCMLSKKQVKAFLVHVDVLPETITIQST